MFRTVTAVLAIFFSPPALALDVHTFTLAKGEQVWYVSDHTLPMIAVSAAIPAGSAYDPKPGLAAFAAAMLDQGAGRLNADAFQTALANRAIRLKVSCNRDWLIVSLVTLTDNAKDAFQLLGLALSQPRFDADAIARVRERILSQLTDDEIRSDRVAEDAFYGAYFHGHPYAHPVDGDRTSVAAVAAGDLKRFASAHWLGGGLRIAASGDFDQATLAALLKTSFGKLPLRNPPAPAFPVHAGDPGLHAVAAAGQRSVAVFGLPGISGIDREYTAALVANYILSEGSSPRLAESSRDKDAFDYQGSTELVTDRRAAFVLGRLTASHGAMRLALDRVRGVLRDYAQNGPTPAELDDAKAALTESFPLSLDSNVATAAALGAYQRAGLGVDFVRKHNALIDAVTLEEVRRAARRLFNPSRLTVAIGEAPKTPASATDPSR